MYILMYRFLPIPLFSNCFNNRTATSVVCNNTCQNKGWHLAITFSITNKQPGSPWDTDYWLTPEYHYRTNDLKYNCMYMYITYKQILTH